MADEYAGFTATAIRCRIATIKRNSIKANTTLIKEALYFLESLGFAKVFFGEDEETYKITESGKAYLEFVKKTKTKYWIATGIAILALIMSGIAILISLI